MKTKKKTGENGNFVIIGLRPVVSAFAFELKIFIIPSSESSSSQLSKKKSDEERKKSK